MFGDETGANLSESFADTKNTFFYHCFNTTNVTQAPFLLALKVDSTA